MAGYRAVFFFGCYATLVTGGTPGSEHAPVQEFQYQHLLQYSASVVPLHVFVVVWIVLLTHLSTANNAPAAKTPQQNTGRQ